MAVTRIMFPRPGWAGFPFYVNLATLHVERTQLDDEILKMVVDQGVTFVRDRVVDLEIADRKICSVQTEGGARFSSPWLIDASGIGASLVARKFNLPVLQYGPTKVGIWTYFKVPQQVEGTTLYMDPMPDGISRMDLGDSGQPRHSQCGIRDSGRSVESQARRAESLVEDVFRRQLMKFPRFEPLLQQDPTERSM